MMFKWIDKYIVRLVTTSRSKDRFPCFITKIMFPTVKIRFDDILIIRSFIDVLFIEINFCTVKVVIGNKRLKSNCNYQAADNGL